MLNNKKISICLIFIIIFVFLLNSISFASNDYYTDKDRQDLFYMSLDYMNSNNYSYKEYVVFEGPNYISIIFLMPENDVAYINEWVDGNEYFNTNYCYIFEFVNGGGFTDTTEPSIKYNSTPRDTYKANTIINSSFNICYNDGTLFFQLAPFPLGVLAPIVEKVETKATVTEMIQVIPLIIVVLVCLVGLRKGLKILSTVLYRCLIF